MSRLKKVQTSVSTPLPVLPSVSGFYNNSALTVVLTCRPHLGRFRVHRPLRPSLRRCVLHFPPQLSAGTTSFDSLFAQTSFVSSRLGRFRESLFLPLHLHQNNTSTLLINPFILDCYFSLLDIPYPYCSRNERTLYYLLPAYLCGFWSEFCLTLRSKDVPRSSAHWFALYNSFDPSK